MMRDIDGVATNDIIQLRIFKDRISRNQVWNYFEIKALMYKDEDEHWKFQFIYLKLLEDPLPEKEVYIWRAFILRGKQTGKSSL